MRFLQPPALSPVPARFIFAFALYIFPFPHYLRAWNGLRMLSQGRVHRLQVRLEFWRLAGEIHARAKIASHEETHRDIIFGAPPASRLLEFRARACISLTPLLT